MKTTSDTNDTPLGIAGVHNLRDIGGLSTTNGRSVRHGLLYRSGIMTELDGASEEAMRALGIAAIFDLRDNPERRTKPTSWHVGTTVEYHSRDHEHSVGDMARLLESGDFTPASALRTIHAIYRRLPFEQVESYRSLFALLVAGRLPLLFNCSAGKDRTGVATALIFHVLGVPLEQIEREYALTDRAQGRLVEIFRSDPKYQLLSSRPLEDYLPLLRADPSYVGIAFAEIEERCGSIEAYLQEYLGVGPAEIEALHATLLE